MQDVLSQFESKGRYTSHHWKQLGDRQITVTWIIFIRKRFQQVTDLDCCQVSLSLSKSRSETSLLKLRASPDCSLGKKGFLLASTGAEFRLRMDESPFSMS